MIKQIKSSEIKKFIQHNPNTVLLDVRTEANLLVNEGYNAINVSDGFSGNNQDPGWKNLKLPSVINN